MQLQFTVLTHYLEADEHPYTVTPTNCDNLLQQALAELRESITASDAMITFDPLPTPMHTPNTYNQLVFHELLDNALKFRDSARPHIQVRAEREDGSWRFAVRDNGIGIAPQPPTNCPASSQEIPTPHRLLRHRRGLGHLQEHR